jgi:hypothetical protein
MFCRLLLGANGDYIIWNCKSTLSVSQAFIHEMSFRNLCLSKRLLSLYGVPKGASLSSGLCESRRRFLNLT